MCQRFKNSARSNMLRWSLILSVCLFLQTIASGQTWNLSWSDEFNQAAGVNIDRTKWTFDKGLLTVDGISNPNGEMQYYCSPFDQDGPSITDPCDETNPNALLDGT